MPESKEEPPAALPTVEVTEVPFSRLEASLAKADIVPRPNSREMKDVYRHAQTSDLDVNELDFDFSLDSSHYPLGSLRSLQQVFDAVQHETHLSNHRNFSDQTFIECLEVSESDGAGWRDLDEEALHSLLQASGFFISLELYVLLSENRTIYAIVKAPLGIEPNIGPLLLQIFQLLVRMGKAVNLRIRKDYSHCMIRACIDPPDIYLSSFVALTPAPNTSFGSKISMTRSSTADLFKSLGLNPLFLLNLIGRPDYWAPQTHWECDNDGNLSACDFFCQHPRWNLQVQGAPLSVYMRYDAVSGSTTYVISHKQNDTSIQTLRNMIDIATRTASGTAKASVFLDSPFDIHVLLSTLSFEASKYHVKRFQRFMWTQINKVDDHLGGLETNDRAKLGELTKQLQIISQNADSHIGNADVAIITANGIRAAHARLHTTITAQPFVYQRATDSIDYVIKSMEKQKIWFLNYKNRKDSTMSLVYNLVTQQDAANNIEIAADMKRDSTSMNAIAALTMAFLPGTFTATVLGAGIFSAIAGSRNVHVSGIWWLWTAITIPLTFITVICWWWYKRSKEKGSKHRPANTEKRPPRQRTFSLSGFSFYSRQDTMGAAV